MKIRKVKNSSGNYSVQVGNYQGKNFKLFKHIGSARSENELEILLDRAKDLIESSQLELFPKNRQEFVDLQKLKAIGYKRSYAYEYLSKFFDQIYETYDKIFKDLVIMRIIKPSSKSQSIELLEEYFGIVYKKSYLHSKLLSFNKEQVIRSTIDYATNHLNFDFSLVFYDVTTLYFETHKEDEFRKNGFSKDNKINQPQILIGLIVDNHGFPISFEVFNGKKFEGHTIIPSIKAFKEKFNIDNLTVVADAGMLSESNLSDLESLGLNYIVGNRTGTLNIVRYLIN